MANHAKFTYQICFFLAIALLVSGFALARLWSGVVISLVYAILWIISYRVQTKWMAPMRLVGYLGLVVAGLLSDLSPFLLIPGISASLACWELDDHRLTSTRSAIAPGSDSQAKLHLLWLVGAIGMGLLISEMSLLLSFELPFGLVVLVVILILFGLVRLIHWLNQSVSSD